MIHDPKFPITSNISISISFQLSPAIPLQTSNQANYSTNHRSFLASFFALKHQISTTRQPFPPILGIFSLQPSSCCGNSFHLCRRSLSSFSPSCVSSLDNRNPASSPISTYCLSMPLVSKQSTAPSKANNCQSTTTTNFT